jgi:hypothetical protein
VISQPGRIPRNPASVIDPTFVIIILPHIVLTSSLRPTHPFKSVLQIRLCSCIADETEKSQTSQYEWAQRDDEGWMEPERKTRREEEIAAIFGDTDEAMIFSEDIYIDYNTHE